MCYKVLSSNIFFSLPRYQKKKESIVLYVIYVFIFQVENWDEMQICLFTLRIEFYRACIYSDLRTADVSTDKEY